MIESNAAAIAARLQVVAEFKPVRDAVQRVLLRMETEARRKAKPHGVDTGTLARSIMSNLNPPMTPIGGSVFTTNRLAPVIEVGRKPGRMPPVDPIARWAKRHGIDAAPFVLARAIGRHGTKGLYMFKAALAVGQRELANDLHGAALRIEQQWRGQL